MSAWRICIAPTTAVRRSIRWCCSNAYCLATCSAFVANDLHRCARDSKTEVSPVSWAYRRLTHRDGYFYKRQYQYDQESDSYRCPAGATLTYRTTGREGYRHYHSDPCVCMGCEQRAQCTSSANHTKVLTRHVWETAKETVDARRLTQWGKRVYQRRKETVERSFADAKQLHGHRYARLRGLAKIMEQCLLAATAQNMKKIALLLARLVAVLCAPTALSIRDTDRLVQIRPQSCQIYFCTPLSLTHLKNDKSPENLGFVSSLKRL